MFNTQEICFEGSQFHRLVRVYYGPGTLQSVFYALKIFFFFPLKVFDRHKHLEDTCYYYHPQDREEAQRD